MPNVEPADKLMQGIVLATLIANVKHTVQRLEHAQRTGDLRGIAEFADELRDTADDLDDLDDLVFGQEEHAPPEQ